MGFVMTSLQAGENEAYKQVTPPPPPLYGVGFYGAIDMGANIYQNRGGDQTFTDDNPNSPFFGSNLEVHPKNDVGFFGGTKLGYVFGTGLIRPTLEGDFFYNGFRGGADFTLNEAFTPCPDCPTVLSTHQRNATTWINTGQFLGISFCDSRPETKSSSRISVPASASIMQSLLVSRSATPRLAPSQSTLAVGEITRIWRSMWLPVLITFLRLTSARLLNTSFLMIRALRSTPGMIAT
jgi:hypothetical protein